jgi:ankyrin repeat protein
VARFLAQHPGALTERVEMDNTALHLACAMGHAESVYRLIEHGAPIESLNCVDRTPLFLACEQGHLGVVQAMLAHGARWDACDRLRRQPLHLAAGGAFEPVVRVLLQAGAFVDPADHIDFTPLFYALHVTPPHLAAQARAWSEKQRAATSLPPLEPMDYAREDRLRCAVVLALLEAGALLTHVGSCGQTPLHRAAEVEHLCPGLYSMLLERGADGTALDANGEPPSTRLRRGARA